MLMILCQTSQADILSDIINGTYEEPSDITYDVEDAGEDHGLDNGEVYHWDNLYLCTYCYDTEVIIDPYGSNNEVGFGD